MTEQEFNHTEAELAKMLRNLPISITITKRGAQSYYWQTYERSGEGESFSDVLEDALLYLFVQFHRRIDNGIL